MMTPPGQNVSALAVIQEVFEEMDQPLVPTAVEAPWVKCSQRLEAEFTRRGTNGSVSLTDFCRNGCVKTVSEVQGDCKEQVACVC